MSKTLRGVYHNLSKSEYEISNSGISLFFSSKFYMNKFLNEYLEERILFKERLKRAMVDIPFRTDFLSDIHLYKKIEKRGFRVTLNGGEISWLDLHQLELVNRICWTTEDWLETHKQK